MRHRLYRLVIVFALSALILTACGVATETTGETGVVKAPAEGEAVAVKEAAAEKEEMVSGSVHEAPQLAELVASGQLPPLEERLPASPKVVTPHEEIGQYGGSWRLGLRGGDDEALLYRTIGYEQMMRWNLAWTEIEPNIAERVEVNEDATEYIFGLREGMKWSDGEDFNADDIMFWYQYVIMDKDVTPAPPKFLSTEVEGEIQTAVFEKIDDYTVKVTFASPNGLFLAQLAAPEGWQMGALPEHWMKQFHPEFNPDVDKLVEEEGFADWIALFQDRAGGDARWQYANRPTLNPWVIVTPYGSNSTLVAAERNPYYWKVDTEGNQLPYIDRVVYEVGNDVDVLVLKALNGEVDNQGRHIATNENKAVFFDNQEAGNYRLVEQLPASSNFMVLNLNLLNKDPVKRELFQNKDFRIALSHAINRQEIIDLILVGEGTPHQPSPLPGTPFYNERLAKQYTEYDPDKANELLDQIGLTERDAEGFRLGPDGQPLIIIIEAITVNTSFIDTLELIKGYWEDVGINMEIKVEDRSIFYERHGANEHDGSVWGGEGGVGWDVYISPKNVLPMHNNGSRFALQWAYWFNNPNAENAEEPPAEVKEQLALYAKVLSVASDAEREELMKQVLEIAADQFYLIGISTPTSGYRIVNNKMRNVPVMVGSWTWPTPGPSNPEQYFYAE